MSKQLNRDGLVSLHTALTEHFVSMLKEGTACSKDLEAMIKFLRDNGIDAEFSLTEEEVPDFIKNLPFFNEDAA